MKIIVVIWADMRTSPAGLPSRLSDDLAGKTVLRRTAEAVLRARTPDGVFLVCGKNDVDNVKSALGGLDIEVFLNEFPDYGFRGEMRRTRKWSLDNWRGGIYEGCFLDEEGTPYALWNLLQREKADGIMQVSGAAAFSDPGIIDAMIGSVKEKRNQLFEFLMTAAPCGYNYVIFARNILQQILEKSALSSSGIKFSLGKSWRDPVLSAVSLPLDEEIITAKARLLVDSDRTLAIARQMYDTLGEDAALADAKKILAVLRRERPDIYRGELPREVEIELTTAADGTDDLRLTGLSGRSSGGEPLFMDFDRYCAIVDELAGMDDILISFGGYGDPFKHPRLFEFISYANEKGIFGIHLAASGEYIDAETFKKLSECGVDAVSVPLDALTKETHAALHPNGDFEKIVDNLLKITPQKREMKTDHPMVFPEFIKLRENVGEMEEFFEKWFAEVGCVDLKGACGFAGQVDDRSIMHLNLGRRVPCEHLLREMTIFADGTVPLCKYDYRAAHPIGNVFKDGVRAIWLGPEMESAWKAHYAAEYGDLPFCAACREWDHM